MAKRSIQKTVGGLRAIELYFRVIRNMTTGEPAFYQSRTQLNTPGLGTLMPENFRELADMSPQCTELFLLELKQAIQTNIKFSKRDLIFEWISVYMPIRYLMQISCDKILLENCQKYDLPANRMCFMLSGQLLMETDGIAARTIRLLRSYGFHFMLMNFGALDCPIMRLADFPVDYVMFSPELTYYLGRDQRTHDAAASVVGFVNDLEIHPIADGIMESYQAETFYDFGCIYCAGSLAGTYLPESEIRQKSDH